MQLGFNFNTNGGYDTETFNEGPIPLSEAEMAEHGILDAHRAMTGETAKQWGSAGMRRREEAASQPQSDCYCVCDSRLRCPFAAAQQPLPAGPGRRFPIALPFPLSCL